MQNKDCQSKGRERIILSGNSSYAGAEEEGLCAGSHRAARREEVSCPAGSPAARRSFQASRLQ